MARAAIDIGSNSLLLTVVDDDGRVLHDEARVVGLGRGLGDRGLFAPDRMKAAEEVLTSYVTTAQKLGVDPWAIKAAATSAARRAMNAETFFARLTQRLKLRVRIISGDEEARLTWLGVRSGMELPSGPVLAVDLGGGSTELVLGTGSRVISRVSLEIGSVRLTEAWLGTGVVDPGRLPHLRKQVDLALAGVHLDPQPRTVVGVAGTATTLAAMGLGLQRWDADAVHGARLTRPQLSRFIDALLAATPEERRALAAVSPERADYLLAGAVILDRVLDVAGRPQMLVSDRGLRYGLLVPSPQEV
jgi:exopolyphosphatase/guanosine-5'-triphosphate,3'-diphosphate pyrophosphatase